MTGEGLLSTATATIEFGRPPEQTGPPFTTVLPLFGAGTTRQFNLPGGFTGAPLGPIKITVAAENFAAAKGSATVTLTNLPASIRQRAAAKARTQSGTFGLAFAATAARSRCIRTWRSALLASAVKRSSCVATFLGNGSRTVIVSAARRPKSATGRNSLSKAATGAFSCPVRRVPVRPPIVAGRVQDFKGGRIHNTTGLGTFYVPAVFVDAIDKRGGEAVTGVPVADPSSSIGPMQTWLFQRFIVPELPKRLPSTLEIRGAPARLYLERQSGHLVDPAIRTAGGDDGNDLGAFPV